MESWVIRLSDEVLAQRIENYARERKISMATAVEQLLRQAVRGEEAIGRKPIGKALDKYRGRWSEAEEQEFLESVEPMNVVDPELWK